MHELGHNLGLGHGGVAIGQDGLPYPIDVNMKPNHLSVMNYDFQMSGLTKGSRTGIMDYLRFGPETLPPLREGAGLNEQTRFGAGSATDGYATKYRCSVNGVYEQQIVRNIRTTPIDWNCKGSRNETGVTANINGDESSEDVLTSQAEWTNLTYKSGAIGRLGLPYVPPPTTRITPDNHELTDVEDKAIIRISSDDGAPTTTASSLPQPNSAGFNTGDVAVTLNATDNQGGSGVKEITYSATGAQSIASTTVPGATTSFTITADGETTISYFARDNAGNVEQAKSLTIKIQRNRPPVAKAGADQTVKEGETVTLNAGESSDPDGDTLSYKWTLVSHNGPDVSLSSATAASPTFATTDNGTYTFRVEVSDGKGGTATDEVAVTVSNGAPTVKAGADATLTSAQTLSMKADFTDPGAKDGPWGFSIDWGDGSPSTGSSPSQGTGVVTGSHQYFAAGTYTVTVCVTDKDEGKGCDELKLEVKRLVIRIDIKPGDEPNSINLKSKGNVTVGVLSATYDGVAFDATTVDRGSLRFAGAPALSIGGAPEDVDRDGDRDVVFHFDTERLDLTQSSTRACLTGQTSGKLQFEGCDSVRIVP